MFDDLILQDLFLFSSFALFSWEWGVKGEGKGKEKG